MDLNRFEWLARRREQAVDPDRVIVDPHHHLWDGHQWRGLMGTYLAPELLEDLTGSHNVVKTVFVDCMSNYDTGCAEHLRPVGETRFVAEEADALDAGGGPTIAGIVGHADLMLGDAVEEVLAAHDAAGGGRFRGIRHATAWDAGDDVHNSHSNPFEHMMGTGEFRAGARRLAAMGFSFDAWLYHPQLPELAALAEAVPELVIVLDHLGGPLRIGPYRRDRDRVRADWRASMRLVAGCSNVVLKVGGIGMDIYYGTGWTARDAPPGSEEVAAHWGDDVRFCIDTFGPDRCMFESNFPVDRQTLPYPVLWNAMQIMAAGYSEAEQEDLFSGTATRTYRLRGRANRCANPVHTGEAVARAALRSQRTRAGMTPLRRGRRSPICARSDTSLDFSMRPEWEALRARARAVAEQGVADYGRWSDSWINGHCKEFSRVLAAEGFIGMTWPAEHGGGGRPGIERIIMAEEMISAGAPLAASWFADRQMGPSIYTYGTDAQKAAFLPGMLSGEASWCIGMSEPDAGSDLASLKTSAVRDGGDYLVNGQKIWTSGAASAEYCYVICRTSSAGPPHRGLSELIVPMDLDGIEVRPVRDMVGNSHFCEIFLTDVRVPVTNLVGAEGGAFKQTMVQLGYERGGIDRLVSNRPLYALALAHADLADPLTRQEVAAIETGYRLGRLMVYRGALGEGSADYSAATKAFCTEHEQRVAEFAARVLGPAATVGVSVPAAVCYAPAYTIQGGTSAIMRNIIGERILGLPREPPLAPPESISG